MASALWDEDFHVPDEDTMRENEDRRAARDAEAWARGQSQPPPELADYRGDPIPFAPPLVSGKPEDVVVPIHGTLLETILTDGPPQEDQAWNCVDVWKPGALTLVVGTQQSFKSWSMFDLMLNAAKGTDWLGHALVPFDTIVYISNEKSKQAVYERMHILFAKEKEAANKVYVRHRGDRIHFGNAAWDKLAVWLRDEMGDKRVLLVLDTLTSLAPPGYDENNLKDVGKALAAIGEIQDGSSVDVMLVHHLNAGGGRPRGHTSLDGAVDGFVRFDRRGRDSPEVIVRFEPKDGMPSTSTHRFLPAHGLFERSQGRKLDVANLRPLVEWWEDANRGDGITVKNIRDRFYNGHRHDQVAKVVQIACDQNVLRQEVRQSLLTNREANLINTVTEQQKLQLEHEDGAVREVQAKVQAETDARMRGEDLMRKRAAKAMHGAPSA